VPPGFFRVGPSWAQRQAAGAEIGKDRRSLIPSARPGDLWGPIGPRWRTTG
jgi:hypothetical protein